MDAFIIVIIRNQKKLKDRGTYEKDYVYWTKLSGKDYFISGDEGEYDHLP